MFAFLRVSLKALTSSKKLKHLSSFEAGTVRFLSSTEDTSRHAACVDLQCGGTVVYANRISGFFLGPGLNLVLWTELPLVAGVSLLASFHLKGSCVTPFQTALPGYTRMQ